MTPRLFAALSAAAIWLVAGPAAALDPLVGMWISKSVSTPGLDGEITLSHAGSVWSASLAGQRATAMATSGRINLTFHGEGGQFRAEVDAAGRLTDSFWVQPAKGFGVLRQPYAIPVALRPTSKSAWLGKIHPMTNSFTLYLKIFGEPDGTLTAALRNPEANFNGGRAQFMVRREGDALQFETRPAEGQRTIRLDGRVTGDHLSLKLPGLDRAFDLARADPQTAERFFPRPAGSPPYHYHAPPALGDGWRTAHAATVGLNEVALAKIVRAEIESDPAGLHPPLIHSILIARHGKLVLEEYFFGFDAATLHDTRSAAKTFNSVMLGSVMLRDGALGPENKIYDLLAGKAPFANPDRRKANISLAHLLTHTSGLACDDNDDDSPGNEDTMQSQTQQPDWAKYTLDLAMAHDPGDRYAYCSANANLVIAALSARTGVWSPQLFDRMIAKPLQFGPYAWDLTPSGDGYGGGGVYMRPRDLLKIGQTYLDGGAWNGRRIVSADWVKRSTAPRIDVSPATTGLTPDAFAQVYNRGKDGYAWHLSELKVGDRIYRDYEATGNGGQLLIVVPDGDLVVVFTGGNYGQGGIWGQWRDRIVAKQIIPAIR